MSIETTAKQLMEAMQPKKGPTAYDTQATVTRVDGDTLWVHIPGGVDETPIQRTINASEGDIVQVRVSNGSAFAMGNASAPPTDDTRANEAMTEASNALTAAATAERAASAALVSADTAESAAAQAVADAATAQTSAQAAQASANAAGESASRAQAAADAAQGDIDEQKEYFWHDALGAHVLSGDDGTVRYRQDITSTGNEIFKQAADGTETSVAVFGSDGARIGESDKSHLEMDFNSMELYSKNNRTYLSVGDMRDASGTATLTEYFTGDGSRTEYTVQYTPSEIVSITPSTIAYTQSGKTITFAVAPARGLDITIKYKTLAEIHHYDFGTRTGNVGADSFVAGAGNAAQDVYTSVTGGDSNQASGYASHIGGGEQNEITSVLSVISGGRINTAKGAVSTVAGGYGNSARGDYSFAGGGMGNIAYGQTSSVFGYQNRATHHYQFVFGAYNERDPSTQPYTDKGTYIEIVGNGTAENARSNARTLDWDGNEVLSGDLTINGSTNVGTELGKKLELLTKTVTGTTNAAGNVALALSCDDYGVLAVTRTDDASICAAYRNANGNWIAHLTGYTSAGAVVANTAVTLEVDYYAK